MLKLRSFPAKPAHIFCADCSPENAVMIGDRIDNDIEPANKLGMKTIWIKQGFAVYQKPMNEFQRADYSVDRIKDILEVFA